AEILVICSHVEMAMTRQGEEDGLALAGSFAFERFVDRDSDCVVGLGGWDYALGASKGDARFEGSALRHRDRFDQPLMVKLRYQWRIAVITQTTRVDGGRNKVPPQSVHSEQRRESLGIPRVVCIVTPSQRGAGLRFHRDQPDLASRGFVRKEGES